jgi:hypothetical protein
MKSSRGTALGVSLGVAMMLSLGMLWPAFVSADPLNVSQGATYLITITNAGAFATRGVLTLHGDHTLSAIDSGQGGPDFFFSSQLGVWAPNGPNSAVGKALDFDFPNADVARLDYTFQFSADNATVRGTITLTIFGIHDDPLDGGGTMTGQFTFDGTRVTP